MLATRRNFIGSTLALAGAAAVAGLPRLARAASRPVERFVVTTPDGLKLSARAYGDPRHPGVVLVHGLGQSRLSWDPQVDSQLSEQLRIVTYDLRGHGDSDKPIDSAAYAEGARWGDDLAAVIAQAGLRRPVVVGWSLGGLVIGHYLAAHGADAVSGVNLVAGVTKLAPDLLTESAGVYAKRLASADLAERSDAIGEFLALCFAKPPSPAAFQRMLAFNGMVPREVQLGIVKISAEGLDRAFAAVPRLLVTHGAKDALVRRAMADRMLQIKPQAKLSLFEQSGHSPFWEESPRFNRELSGFVKV
ncbi:MAG: alpha/beta hydrolase [Polyangiales bacterium]